MTDARDAAASAREADPPAGGDAGSTTRERILEVAGRHFAEHGYRRTSVAAVARELSLTPPAVYFHFAGKDELFVAAYDREAGLLCDAVVGADAEIAESDLWDLFMPKIITNLPRHPLVLRVLRGEEPELVPRLAAGEIPLRLRVAFVVALRKGQQQGRVRMDIDREQMAIAMEAILLALLLTATQAGGVGSAERAGPVRALLQAALRR
ncbi:TetR/AcrR family transcriptional regulator [Nocardia sp. alder85J]|uniref:TetR/AcrR family transcriptional regulator n=1 Tax=Nocardia sp. alder85J TaxID=2862949 RepID=UPI001CD6BC60|nr:TetR/AcrR family transcriptional regulator [Nocardia sp. alder85J]MCX4095846.1 helix-turn-helix domain containing protein [Nocardia sp. alder85J]